MGLVKLKFPKKRVINHDISSFNKPIIEKEEVLNEIIDEPKEEEVKVKNKQNKKKNDMDITDRIKEAEATIEAIAPEVKVVKKDRGLIERTESSKIIITEDNRQVLID
jgi:hypothetical protein